MEKRYKIFYDKKKCMGAFACIPAESGTWKEGNAKAELIGGILMDDAETEVYVKEVDDLENNMEAAEVCPARCIHIIDTKTGKKLI